MRFWLLNEFGSVGFVFAVMSLLVQPAYGEKPAKEIKTVTEKKSFSASAADLLVQQPPISIIKVTGVKINSTAKGIEVILESTNPAQLQPINKSKGNDFIADIPNTVLSLPSGKDFNIANPVKGIDKVSVTQVDGNRSNVLTEDPDNPGFDIQTGEQNSQGVELNLAGEIAPGWRITAGYAYNDARITEDNTFEEGNRLNNAPENAFSLWTTYQIQKGSMQGLGFGLGLFYVGERQGDLDNSFTLPSYLRTDAALFYEKNKFRAAINIRNLFDIDYFETAQNDLRVYPGSPLTVIGSVSWKF